MCGIAGVFDFSNKPISPEALRSMGDMLRHRGPDGEGAVLFRISAGTAHWWEAGAAPIEGAQGGFVHRRLAIIDLSPAGRQPMHDGGERFWVTYNGEIYNYIELMTELKGRGYQFRSHSDTEVILHAFREWGPSCVDRLNGMFAFALWDREERRLFAARDRLGIKPFYFRVDGGRISFASEIKALLEPEGSARRANVAAITDFISFSFSPSDDTFFVGIQKLPPATRLTADAGGMRLETYWRPVHEEAPGVGDGALVDELRGLLDDAVRLQLRSDVPVGAHLSGGIDSSAVCALAARHLPQIQTFTARYAEGGQYDESEYARKVVTAIQSLHCEVVPRGGDIRDLLRRIVFHLDQPVEGAAVFGKFHVAESVGRHVKVVLGGQGGDELFGGYDWYVKTLLIAACFGGGGSLGGRQVWPFIARAWEGGSKPRLIRAVAMNFGERDVGEIFRRCWRRTGDGGERLFLQADRLRDVESSDDRFRAAFARLPERDPVERMFHFDQRFYLPELLHSEDRMSMAFSVESRVPLLDHRIVELAARAGARRKTIPGRSKDLLRQALQGIVPPAILSRRDKRGFPTPVGAWLRDPEIGLVERFVRPDVPLVRDLLDVDAVRRWARRRIVVGTSWSEMLWRIVTVAAWGEQFDVRV